MSLNFDWLWVYVTVSVVKGSLLDKGVKNTFVYGYNDKYLHAFRYNIGLVKWQLWVFLQNLWFH